MKTATRRQERLRCSEKCKYEYTWMKEEDEAEERKGIISFAKDHRERGDEHACMRKHGKVKKRGAGKHRQNRKWKDCLGPTKELMKEDVNRLLLGFVEKG